MTVFVLTLFVILPGCGGNNATSIEKVLKQDSVTSDNATSIADVVKRMRAIDLSSCPNDFKAAYVEHIHAWESAASIESEVQMFSERYNSSSGLLESFLRGAMFDFGMVGEAGAAYDRLVAHQQQVSADIQRTFHDVENIAIKFGAQLPQKPE